MDCNGIGAFFYPDILGITENGTTTLDDVLTKPPGFETRKIVIDHKLKNNMRIIVTDDGFVGIFEASDLEALRILNTILATGITFGIGSEFVTEKDLCKFMLIDDDDSIQFNQIRWPSERNTISFYRDRDSEFGKWRTYRPRHVASKDDVIKMLDKSYDYLAARDSGGNLYVDILLALEGYTLYYREAFRGAYVYGWMIIETIIDQIWKEYVTTLRISSDDKKKLKESSQWTAHHQIEILFALRKIDLTSRNFLTKLRKKRNNIIHDKESVESHEAFGCLRLAVVMTLNRKLDNPDIFYDPKGNPLVRAWHCDRQET